MKHYPFKSKGFIGGAILVVLGLAEIAFGYVETGTTLIGLGLGILGIRDKLERIKKG